MPAHFDISTILDGCRRGDRNSQRKLYEHFYGYGMSICLRYAHDKGEAAEILNEGFFKALRNILQYDAGKPFRFWLRQIFVHTAIDHFRKRHNIPVPEELTLLHCLETDEMTDFEIDPDEDVLPILQKLSPAYRTVFNLYVMEEYSHAEIAAMLGISAAASRSNLTRAKEQLREIWLKEHGFIKNRK